MEFTRREVRADTFHQSQREQAIAASGLGAAQRLEAVLYRVQGANSLDGCR